jgi:hypothetical protein
MIQLARIILSHAISESHGTRLVYKKNESTYGRINRSPTAALLVAITPGEPFAFPRPGASISIMAGSSPLLLGDKSCQSFAVSVDNTAVLAGRLLRSGRFLLHHALMYSESGRIALRLNKDVLELNGVTF